MHTVEGPRGAAATTGAMFRQLFSETALGAHGRRAMRCSCHSELPQRVLCLGCVEELVEGDAQWCSLVHRPKHHEAPPPSVHSQCKMACATFGWVE